MKKVVIVLLAAILAVVSFVAYQNSEADKHTRRAEAEKTLSECWRNAVANGVGADVCKSLAETLNK